MILDYINNKQCCGCGACSMTCTHKAIAMVEDTEGFLQPILSKNKCINCGACDNVCPIYHSQATVHNVVKSFAAINNNKKNLKKSSSGGIFSAIAEYIIQKGGIVYGAAFDTNLKLSHKGIEKLEEIEPLRGSKYLQSYSYECFPEIKRHLKNNQLVYFVGTGCQVASLKLYLHKDYDTLITSDLICHGVPSHKLFEAFVSAYEKNTSRSVINYRFRDKFAGGWSGSQTVDYICGRKIKKDLFNPILAGYMKAFMSADFFRESCYSCPFACEQRAGDITLADFWGIEKYHKINSINGVSAILVNTARGEELFTRLKSKIHTIDTKVEYIKKENDNLHKPSKRPAYRDKSYYKLQSDTINTLNKYINYSAFIKYKFWIKHYMLRFQIYELYFKLKNI